MVASEEITSESFDPKTKTLTVKWEVKKTKAESDKTVVSQLFSHEPSSEIKWRFQLDINSTDCKFSLIPEDAKINQRYKYVIKLVVDRDDYMPTERTLNLGTSFGKDLTDLAKFDKLIAIKMTIVYPPEVFMTPYLESLSPINFFSKTNRSLFCDMKFKVEGQILMAHRPILAFQSPVFMKMLTMVNQDSKPGATIDVKDATVAGFNAFLDVVYRIKAPTDPLVFIELIYLAEKYDMQEIKEFAKKRVVGSLNQENAINLLMKAEEIHATEFRNEILAFISKQKVEDMPDFDILCSKPDLMKQVMKKTRNYITK